LIKIIESSIYEKNLDDTKKMDTITNSSPEKYDVHFFCWKNLEKKETPTIILLYCSSQLLKYWCDRYDFWHTKKTNLKKKRCATFQKILNTFLFFFTQCYNSTALLKLLTSFFHQLHN